MISKICITSLLLIALQSSYAEVNDAKLMNLKNTTNLTDSNDIPNGIPQLRLTQEYWKNYPKSRNAKQSQSNTTPYHKYLLVKIAKGTPSQTWWSFWAQYSYRRNAVTCTTFNLPCSVGYLTLTKDSGVLPKRYCGTRIPYHHVTNVAYLRVSYFIYPDSDTTDVDVACRVSGISKSEAKTLYQEDPAPYCPSNPADLPDTYGTVQDCVCGIGKTTLARVAGEDPTEDNAHPWLVSIHKGSASSVEEVHAKGSLLTSKHVITAASAVHGAIISEISVTVGNDVLGDTSTGSSHSVVDVVEFDYDEFTHEHNVAILEISPAVDLVSNTVIKPICLPSLCDNFEGNTAVVTGWGHMDDFGQVLPGEIYETSTTVEDEATCLSHWPHLTSEMMCAEGACVTDLGAPLTVTMPNGQRVLAGVLSHAVGCQSSSGKPGVYSRITSYLDDIISTITGSEVCESYYHNQF